MIHRLMGVFTLLLLLVTFPLWGSPPTSENPHIPWFNWGVSVPFLLDQVLLAILVIAICGMIIWPNLRRYRRLTTIGYFVTLFFLILLDQHRLQPWALQFLLFAFVLAISDQKTGVKCCRWIVLTIYFYSAISKFDVTFYTSHGQFLLNGLLKALNIDGSFWSDEFRSWIAMLFPLGELLVVILLIIRKTLHLGVIFSWVMHLSIILAVGPLGLNHEYGVILWNLFFIVQNYILFWTMQESDRTKTAGSKAGNRIAIAFTMLMAILPVLENGNWYDHWPAWAVYSSRPEKVEILIDEPAATKYPNHLTALCGPQKIFEEKIPLSLDKWSFQERKCPIYPQLRFRLAIAKALLEPFTQSEDILIEIEHSPDRWTGNKKRVKIRGWEAVDEYLNTNFHINTKPRLTQP